MASYTLTTTPVQEAALTAVVAQANALIDVANAQLAAQTPPGTPTPHWTNTTYLMQRIADVLSSYGSQNQLAIAATALLKYETLPTVTQVQILTVLGMADYAALPIASQAKALTTIGLQAFLALPVATQNQLFVAAGITA